jgi:hypothetical protein
LALGPTEIWAEIDQFQRSFLIDEKPAVGWAGSARNKIVCGASVFFLSLAQSR